MATTGEMSLARQILQLGMLITAQGKKLVQVDYHGHVDSLDVWVNIDGAGTLKGWGPCDHTVYLGKFHTRFATIPEKKTEGEKQLKALLKEMDSLIEKDADDDAHFATR